MTKKGYTKDVVDSIATNDLESTMFYLEKITPEDIRRVVEVYVSGRIKSLDQDVLITVCILTNNVELLIDIYRDLIRDVSHQGKEMTASRIIRALSNRDIYRYFIYEKQSQLKELLKVQIALSDITPVIPYSVIDNECLYELSNGEKNLVAEYLKDYFNYFNKKRLPFPLVWQQDLSMVYAITMFKTMIDLEEFYNIIEIEHFLKKVESWQIEDGLRVLLECKNEGEYDKKLSGVESFLKKQVNIQKRRKKRVEIILRDLSKLGVVAAVVFKNQMDGLMEYFDFPELMKKFPEDFV